MVRMMSWSEALPGKVQQRTGMPSRVTAMPITTWGRSGRLSLECLEKRRVAASLGPLPAAPAVAAVALAAASSLAPASSTSASARSLSKEVELVSTKITSQARLRRLAVVAKTPSATPGQGAGEEVHGGVGGVGVEARAAFHGHPLGDPARGRQLGTGLEGALRDEREADALDGGSVEATPCGRLS